MPMVPKQPFNDGRPYHGSEAVQNGRLTGTTDTDHFYFFCPRCDGRHIMRVMNYEVREERMGGTTYANEEPRSEWDFILALKLHCSKCTLTDFIKIGNLGWQGGELPQRD